MIKFKKDYKLKIISVVVAIAFLVTSTAYGIDLSSKTNLRSPLVFDKDDNDPERVEEALGLISHNSSTSNTLTKEEISALMEEKGYPELSQLWNYFVKLGIDIDTIDEAKLQKNRNRYVLLIRPFISIAYNIRPFLRALFFIAVTTVASAVLALALDLPFWTIFPILSPLLIYGFALTTFMKYLVIESPYNPDRIRTMLLATLLTKRDYREDFDNLPKSREVVDRLRSVGINEFWDDPEYSMRYKIQGKTVVQADSDLDFIAITREALFALIGYRDENGTPHYGKLAGSLKNGAKTARMLLKRWSKGIEAIKAGQVTSEFCLAVLQDIKSDYIKPGSKGERAIDEYVDMISRGVYLLDGEVEANIWQRDPWIDLSNALEFHTCVFLGERDDVAAFGYIKNKSLSCLDFNTRKGRMVRVIMGAGVFTDKDGREKGVLVVDSVEGLAAFDRRLITKAIEEYAASCGFSKVFYNKNAAGMVPKEVVEHARETGAKLEGLDIALVDDSNREYLETFGRPYFIEWMPGKAGNILNKIWSFFHRIKFVYPRGKVRGYTVNLEPQTGIPVKEGGVLIADGDISTGENLDKEKAFEDWIKGIKQDDLRSELRFLPILDELVKNLKDEWGRKRLASAKAIHHLMKIGVITREEVLTRLPLLSLVSGLTDESLDTQGGSAEAIKILIEAGVITKENIEKLGIVGRLARGLKNTHFEEEVLRQTGRVDIIKYFIDKGLTTHEELREKISLKDLIDGLNSNEVLIRLGSAVAIRFLINEGIVAKDEIRESVSLKSLLSSQKRGGDKADKDEFEAATLQIIHLLIEDEIVTAEEIKNQGLIDSLIKNFVDKERYYIAMRSIKIIQLAIEKGWLTLEEVKQNDILNKLIGDLTKESSLLRSASAEAICSIIDAGYIDDVEAPVLIDKLIDSLNISTWGPTAECARALNLLVERSYITSERVRERLALDKMLEVLYRGYRKQPLETAKALVFLLDGIITKEETRQKLSLDKLFENINERGEEFKYYLLHDIVPIFVEAGIITIEEVRKKISLGQLISELDKDSLSYPDRDFRTDKIIRLYLKHGIITEEDIKKHKAKFIELLTHSDHRIRSLAIEMIQYLIDNNLINKSDIKKRQILNDSIAGLTKVKRVGLDTRPNMKRDTRIYLEGLIALGTYDHDDANVISDSARVMRLYVENGWITKEDIRPIDVSQVQSVFLFDRVGKDTLDDYTLHSFYYYYVSLLESLMESIEDENKGLAGRFARRFIGDNALIYRHFNFVFKDLIELYNLLNNDEDKVFFFKRLTRRIRQGKTVEETIQSILSGLTERVTKRIEKDTPLFPSSELYLMKILFWSNQKGYGSYFDKLKRAIRLRSIQFNDGGNSFSVTSNIAEDCMLRADPLKFQQLPISPPQFKPIELSRVPIKDKDALLSLLDKASVMNGLGRTVAYKTEDGVYFGIKFLRYSEVTLPNGTIQKVNEDPGKLYFESEFFDYLHGLEKIGLPLEADYPRSMLIDGESVVRIKVEDVPQEIRSKLDEFKSQPAKPNEESCADTTNGYYTLMVYRVENPQYFSYIHQAKDNQIDEAVRKNIHDLFLLARFGLVHPDIIELFHNLIQIARQDRGRYLWMADVILTIASRTGAGRLHGWETTVGFPNPRVSGPSDFAEMVTIDELVNLVHDHSMYMGELGRFPEEDRKKFLLAHFMGNYTLALALCEGERLKSLGRLDWNKTDEIAGFMRRMYSLAYKTFTGEDDDEIEDFVDWHMFARQMAFFMGGEYRDYTDKDIPEEIYGIEGIRIEPGDGWGFIHIDVIEKAIRKHKDLNDIEISSIIEKYFDIPEPSGRRQIPEGIYVFKDNFESLNGREVNGKIKAIMKGLHGEYSKGWRFDGIHEDLGPVNGPNPLQELIKANYVYTMFMIGKGPARETPEALERMSQVIDQPIETKKGPFREKPLPQDSQTLLLYVSFRQLIEKLNDRAMEVQNAAATALGEIAKARRELAEGITSRFFELLNDDDSDVRTAAATAIGEIAKARRELAEGIISIAFEKLNDTDSYIRSGAAAIIGGIAKARPDLITKGITNCLFEKLNDDDSDVRTAAATALGGIAKTRPNLITREITNRLFEKLNDDSLYVQRAAATTIGEIAKTRPNLITKRITNCLFEKLSVESAFATSIGNIAKTHPNLITEGIPNRIFELLNDDDSDVRTAAATAIGEIAKARRELAEGIISIAFEKLNDSDSHIRSGAAAVIGGIAKTRPDLITKEITNRLFKRLKGLKSVDDNDLSIIFDLGDEIPKAIGEIAKVRPDLITKEDVSYLFEEIDDSPFAVGDKTAIALAEIAKVRRELAKGIFDRLSERLDTSEWMFMSASMEIAIREIVGAYPDFLTEGLFERLFSTSSEIFSTTIGEIVSSRPELITERIIDNLFGRLNDEYTYKGHEAAMAIGKIVKVRPDLIAEEKINRLFEGLNDDSLSVNSAAATAIGEIAKARRELAEGIISIAFEKLNDTDSYIRSGAAAIIGGIAKAWPDLITKGITHRLFEKLNDSDPHVRSAAVAAIGEIIAAAGIDLRKIDYYKEELLSSKGAFRLKESELLEGYLVTSFFIERGEDFGLWLDFEERQDGNFSRLISLLANTIVLEVGDGALNILKEKHSIKQTILSLEELLLNKAGLDLYSPTRSWNNLEEWINYCNGFIDKVPEMALSHIIITMKLLQAGIGEEAGFRESADVERRVPEIRRALIQLLSKPLPILIKRRLVKALALGSPDQIDRLRNQAIELAVAVTGADIREGCLVGDIRTRIHNQPSPQDLTVVRAYRTFVESGDASQLNRMGYDVSDSDSISTERRGEVLDACDTLIITLENVYGEGSISSIEEYFQRWQNAVTGHDKLEVKIATLLSSAPVASLEYLEGIIQIREGLHLLLNDLTGEPLLLSIALDNRLEILFYRQFNTIKEEIDLSAPEDTLKSMRYLVKNTRLNGYAGEELVIIEREFDFLSSKAAFSQEDWLKLYSVYKRIERIINATSQSTISNFQTMAERLASGIGAGESIWVENFSSNIFRSDTIYLLSLALTEFKEIAMQKAEISGWQVVVPGETEGRVRFIKDTSELKSVKEDEIIVIGRLPSEAPPVTATAGIITLKEDGLLSHPAIRARQHSIPFAVCPDIDLLDGLDGEWVRITIKGEEVVLSREEEPVKTRGPPERIAREQISIIPANLDGDIVVMPENYQPSTVGNKSFRLEQMPTDLLSEQISLRHFSSSFSLFKQVLDLDVNSEIKAQLTALQEKTMDDPYGDEITDTLKEIRRVTEKLYIPENYLDIIIQTIEELFGKDSGIRLFLRSSTNAEDLPGYEAAGLYGSFGNVLPEREELAKYIKKVWASIWNDRAFFDRQVNGINHTEVFPAVLVQQMTMPDYAFVIHTQNPDGADDGRDEVIIELVQGLGESLVSGEEEFSGSPYRFIFNRRTRELRINSFANKSKKLIVENGTLRSVYASYAGDLLSAEEGFRIIANIAEASLGIEKIFRYPQDIEGAIVLENGKWKVAFVQSRNQHLTGKREGDSPDGKLTESDDLYEELPDAYKTLDFLTNDELIRYFTTTPGNLKGLERSEAASKSLIKKGAIGILSVGTLGMALFHYLEADYILSRTASKNNAQLNNTSSIRLFTDNEQRQVYIGDKYHSDLIEALKTGNVPELVIVSVNADQLTEVADDITLFLEALAKDSLLTVGEDIERYIPKFLLVCNALFIDREFRSYLSNNMRDSSILKGLPVAMREKITGHVIRGVAFQAGERVSDGPEAVYIPGKKGRMYLGGGDTGLRKQVYGIFQERQYEVRDFGDSALVPEIQKALVNLMINVVPLCFIVDEKGEMRNIKQGDLVLPTGDAELDSLMHPMAIQAFVTVYRIGQRIGVFDESEERFEAAKAERLRRLAERNVGHIPSSLALARRMYDKGTLDPYHLPPSEESLVNGLIAIARDYDMSGEVIFLEEMRDRIKSNFQRLTGAEPFQFSGYTAMVEYVGDSIIRAQPKEPKRPFIVGVRGITAGGKTTLVFGEADGRVSTKVGLSLGDYLRSQGFHVVELRQDWWTVPRGVRAEWRNNPDPETAEQYLNHIIFWYRWADLRSRLLQIRDSAPGTVVTLENLFNRGDEGRLTLEVPIVIHPDSIILLDGSYLDYAVPDLIDYGIWIEISLDEARRRRIARQSPGYSDADAEELWTEVIRPSMEWYLARYGPLARSNIVIDMESLESPLLIEPPLHGETILARSLPKDIEQLTQQTAPVVPTIRSIGEKILPATRAIDSSV
ncbi:PEP/pyruvate-binding domain-containing protein [Candidatus Omnitrophota bacterium]